MKRLLFFFIFFLAIISIPMTAFAQISDDHTENEEAEGKEIWEKLQAKQITCSDLTDENFGALGEYYMGQAIGSTQRHATMNQMMTNMMGEDGEEQMHIILGKRSSGCNTNAQLPSEYNFMPMMWMIGSAFAPESYGGTKGGGNPMPALSRVEGMGYGGWNNMMGGWGGFSWIFMIIFWVLIILGVIALVRYLGGYHNTYKGRTPLDILKERYAKGDIDKKEFEAKKKDLS